MFTEHQISFNYCSSRLLLCIQVAAYNFFYKTGSFLRLFCTKIMQFSRNFLNPGERNFKITRRRNYCISVLEGSRDFSLHVKTQNNRNDHNYKHLTDQIIAQRVYFQEKIFFDFEKVFLASILLCNYNKNRQKS